MIDAVLGLMIGALQGWILRPIFICCFRYTVCGISTIVKSVAVRTLLGSLIASLVVGFFLLTTLLARGFIVAWSSFLAGWSFGFVIGAFAYAAVRTRSD